MPKPKNKPTVLLISFIFSPNIGGVESHLDDLCEYLCNKGYKIIVLTYQPLTTRASAPFFEKKKNMEIRRIPWLGFNLFNKLEKYPPLLMLYLIPPIFCYGLLYLMRNRKKIDVIQTHGFNMAIVGALLSILFKIRFTVNTHVSFYFQKKSLYSLLLKSVLQRASFILTLTNEAKNELVRIGIKREKVKVYHQWINRKLFVQKNKKNTRSAYKISKNAFVVLFIGRLIPQKGVALLLEATTRAKKNVLYVFVGSGYLKELIQKSSLQQPSIQFIGEVKREELPFLYSLADICIFPSTQNTARYAEGIPRVMIESFSCGTPVIATSTGGVKELIKKDIGFLIDPSSTAISQLVASLYRRKQTLAHMSKRCKDYAKTEFSIKENGHIIEESLL